jgi:vitamin B12 transporter
MRLLLTTAALAASLAPLCARAADDPLSELVVTATRLPADVGQVTGAYVIDQAEIEARQTPFVADLLRTVPGVTVSTNGAFGGVAAIRIRGASPDKTLVLVDGVPVGDPADPNGTFDASALQSLDVARIEVLEGPQGSLWGSDAIGGVVSITTRELDGVRAALEGGSLGTARGSLGAGVARARYAISGSVSGFTTDGVSKAEGGAERDPFRTVSGGLAGRVELSDSLRVDARLRATYAKVDIDGFPAPDFQLADTPDRDKSRSWQGELRATYDGAFGLTQTLSVSAYRLWRRDISDFPAVYVADRRVWRWTAARGANTDPWAFVVGAERQATHADLSGRASDGLSTTSAFAVGRVRPWAPLTLTGSLRWDDPDRFRARTSARLAAELALGRQVTVTASAGQGFKVPSISEVVCDFCFAPPAPLRPERAEGYDLRLGWRSADGRLSAAATGYRLAVRDQIAFVGPRYVNIARTRSTGFQAEADAALTNALALRLAYAATRAIDASTGLRLLRVPRATGAVSLFWTRDPWSAALTVRGESSQPDVARDGFSPAKRAGFVVADLAGTYRLTRALTLTARVENLTDKRYEETFGFGQPGRTVMVGVRIGR